MNSTFALAEAADQLEELGFWIIPDAVPPKMLDELTRAVEMLTPKNAPTFYRVAKSTPLQRQSHFAADALKRSADALTCHFTPTVSNISAIPKRISPSKSADRITSFRASYQFCVAANSDSLRAIARAAALGSYFFAVLAM